MTSVLHVDGSTEFYGGQKQLVYLARALQQPVVTTSGAALERHIPELAMGLPWWRPQLRARAVLSVAPDLLAVHTSRDLHWVASSNLPFVVHRRVDDVPSRPAIRRINKARAVIAVSECVRRSLLAAGVKSPIKVVYDGVRVERREPMVWPRSFVVSIGALKPHKGHAVLIQAMTAVPDLDLVIVGEGKERNRLHRLAKRLGLAERVFLVGHQPQPERWLLGSKLLVHPSLSEGLGQVVLEAIHLGVPVVGTLGGGTKELLQHVAPLVPPADPQALARAIREASPLHEPATVVEKTSVEAMVSATAAVYERFAD